MATAASAFHVTRDRFHLAWDPAIPPIATVEIRQRRRRSTVSTRAAAS